MTNTIIYNQLYLDIATPTKEEPSDKLDVLLNPDKAKQHKEDTKMAMNDLRDGTLNIVTYECFKLKNCKLRAIYYL